MEELPPNSQGLSKPLPEKIQTVFQRFSADLLAQARLDTPAILLTGARQVGKSTLARAAARVASGETITIRPNSIADSPREAKFISLDDANIRAAAAAEPQGFLERYRGTHGLVVDEVQRVPELLIAVKREIDRDRSPGRFILTGSSNVMSIPSIAEALVGRIEILALRPLAQSELIGSRSDFLECAFQPEFPTFESTEEPRQIVERALRGGYPEPLSRKRADRRNAWFGNYITTVVQREITSISAIEDTTAIVRVLRALASRSGGPRNFQTLSIDAAIPVSTVARYVALLFATFLVSELPPWSNNLDARLMKAPKLILNDSGLYSYLLGIHADDDRAGLLIETFAGGELLKLASWAAVPTSVMHFRDRRGNEVDFVLERPNRDIVGIEVKKSRSISSADFRGLRKLAELSGEHFARGIVLYCGAQTLAFGARLLAVPIGALWSRLGTLSPA